jgi:tape measure domain-containing protein
MALNTEQANLILTINGTQAGTTLRDLRNKSRDLQRALDECSDPTEFARLTKELNAVNAKLREVRQSTNGVGKAMSEARTEGSAFFNSMTNFIARAMIAWYGLQQLIGALYKPSQIASELEQAQIAFETMLGSSVKARALVNSIVKKAAETPFETKELIDYAQRLLAMGISGDKVIDTVSRLGDIAAGVGKEKLPQIVLAFGQVAAKTKLAGGELKQFTEAGIPLVAALADQFKVADAEIFKMVEDGKVGFKDVEKAIKSMTDEGGKFAGLMGKQAQTTEGLMSTLRDNISLALAAFGEGFNTVFKDILKNTIAFTNGLDRDKIKAWGEAVGKALKFLIDFAPALLKVLAIYGTFRVVSAATSAIQGFSAALKASETIQLLFNSGLARSIALQTALNRLFTASAIPFWGTAIVAVTLAVQSLHSKMTELTQVHKDLNKAQEEGAKSAQVEMQSATNLFEVIRDGSATYKQRQDAIGKILELYPDYLGSINTETELLNNLDEAQKRVNIGIIEAAFAKIKAQELERRGADRITREIELNRAKDAALKAARERDATTYSPTASGPNTYDPKTRQTIAAGSKAGLAAELAERNKIADAADSEYFKNFNTAASTTADLLLKNLTPSWSYLNEKIAETKKLLLANPNDAGLLLQLRQLEAEKSREFDAITKREQQRRTSDSDEKKKKDDTLKRQKEHYDLLLQLQENYRDKALFANKQLFELNERDDYTHQERELEIKQVFYRRVLEIQRGYLNQLKKGTKEYAQQEGTILGSIEKLSDTDIRLRELRAEKERRVNFKPTETLTAPTNQNAKSLFAEYEKFDKIKSAYEDLDKNKIIEKRNFLFHNELAIQAELHRLQIQGAEARLRELERLGLKDTEQYKKVAKDKAEVEKDLTKIIEAQEEERKRAKAEVTNSLQGLIADLFQFEIDQMSKSEADKKRNAEKIKKLQRTQIIISGIAEVAKIWETWAGNPIVAALLTGISAARTGFAVAKVDGQKFAAGGMPKVGMFGGKPHSQGGVNGYFDDGTQINVERDEAFVILNKRSSALLRRLSDLNVVGGGVPFFGEGGALTLNTTPIVPISAGSPMVAIDLKPLVAEIQDLKSVVANQQTKLRAIVVRDEITAQVQQDAEDRLAAAV